MFSMSVCENNTCY